MGFSLSVYVVQFSFIVAFFSWLALGLQCYSCNIIAGAKYMDMGCTNPEIITCSQSHKGFKQRFCIKTESVVLGMLLTSGCATSRHCQQQELPGVRIHCCDTDLCNHGPRQATSHLLYLCICLCWAAVFGFFL
ncbi:uncharacterized protein WCC33_015558 [Rhinophrynus dorsalis]